MIFGLLVLPTSLLALSNQVKMARTRNYLNAHAKNFDGYGLIYKTAPSSEAQKEQPACARRKMQPWSCYKK